MGLAVISWPSLRVLRGFVSSFLSQTHQVQVAPGCELNAKLTASVLLRGTCQPRIVILLHTGKE